MGECRIVTWFWPLISILVSSKQIFASSSKRPADHQHGFLVRSSACFFLQIISMFFSSDNQLVFFFRSSAWLGQSAAAAFAAHSAPSTTSANA